MKTIINGVFMAAALVCSTATVIAQVMEPNCCYVGDPPQGPVCCMRTNQDCGSKTLYGTIPLSFGLYNVQCRASSQGKYPSVIGGPSGFFKSITTTTNYSCTWSCTAWYDTESTQLTSTVFQTATEPDNHSGACPDQ